MLDVSMDKNYNHLEKENYIYKKWEDNNLFSPEGVFLYREKFGLENKSETFTILMPPPNANAPLHCGHATYSLQDLMCRIKRMQGYKTLYVPGTDHAGFETQVVYERKLKKEGKSRFNFDRQTLYNDILEFVKENSGVAINQLRSLGMSADWNRNTFMLDEHVVDTVYNTFIKMHDEGLVYRDDYMVNYSPYHGTTFSNLETEHMEMVSPLYYVKYQLKDLDNNSKDFITVATVRPETIFADVAIAVNPNDSRYKKYVGRYVINPLNGREMVVIEDDYVDMEFGTGALKVTPGHDFNDYEIGKRHNLECISLLDLEGKMNNNAPELEGVFVIKARTITVEMLEKNGSLVKVDETYKNNVLVDYKDKKPIEPTLLPNWFVKMESLSKNAIEVIKDNQIRFVKPMWKKEILRWLENIKDWPISRQTVFGIRIPVWYEAKNNDLFGVFLDSEGNSHEGKIDDLLKEYSLEEIKKGLQKIIASKSAKYVISKEALEGDYIQETDTFDTWFSSGQWPMTTLRYPDDDDFKNFFPTDVMESMWDILFFWIARMIMFSLYLTNKIPFKTVYIHGVITDEKGQKMSKSKGNVINPMDLVEKYGADALRMGLIVGGNTLARETSLQEGKIKGYRNFANKIWNMSRFMIMMFEESKIEDFTIDETKLNTVDKEILSKYNEFKRQVNSNYKKYRFSDAGEQIYHFMWHEIADLYIEDVKKREGMDKLNGLRVLREIYIGCLKLLHPLMPFVTESIYEYLPKENDSDLLIVSRWN